ncbi:tyrosine-type recombinase/integrase [Escherichia coli]
MSAIYTQIKNDTSKAMLPGQPRFSQPYRAVTDPALAARLRNLAATVPGLIKYLLQHEASFLIACTANLDRRMFFDTLFNTGARLNEALALSPESFSFGATPTVELVTLKARKKKAAWGKGRPTREQETDVRRETRIVPLLDRAYAARMRDYLDAYHRRKKTARIWTAQSRQTPATWMNEAVREAERRGMALSIPVTCHTLRHSYAMHLLMHGLDERTLMALMGHKYPRSLLVYTRVFALDVLADSTITFTQDAQAVAALPGLGGLIR